ncbi:MAG: 4-(cytidine 5'-diphospho)-2-C-methyl-D-erythritol kinase [Thermodesulfobacteriota bacterium]
MSSTSVLSPAKINLFLKVLRKRDDGFHELYSLMQPVTLYDNISIDAQEGEGISLECHHAELPADHTNLAWRAARLLLDTTGIKKRITITIDKKIPVGAGLGGGSSNAAAVLMALNDLLNAGLTEGKLMEMGALLGSDVPFFILGGPALATGRGEVLSRVALPGCHYILINPGISVSTAWVYGNLNLTKNPEDNNLSYSGEALRSCADVAALLANDLEPVTTGRFPEISRLKALLVEHGALGALMSGSGATVFGLFSTHAAARGALEGIRPLLDEEASIFLVHGVE